MGILSWIAHNWFTVLQSAGIIGSLLFTGFALRIDAKSRRITNLISLTAHHREIWSDFQRKPQLARVLDPRAAVSKRPVTEEEDVFVTMIALHLNAMYHAIKDGQTLAPEGIKQDIHSFFSLPVPRVVWIRIKPFQDRDFARFVESAITFSQ